MPARGPQGPRPRTAKVVGSIFCIFHLCLIISEVREEPKGVAQSSGASWHFALLPFIRLTTSLSHPCAEIRVKAMPRQHMPASSPHSRVFSWQVLGSTGLGAQF